MDTATGSDLGTLVERLGIREPVLGLYDAPDPQPFAPLVRPAETGHACIWAFSEQMRRGRTVHLTAARHGCGGLGRALFGLQTRDRESYLAFLADDEGLKASRALMGRWLDAHPPYQPRHPHLLFGPLRPGRESELVSATFLVDPDQLSSLIIGAHYHAEPDDPAPVVAEFGSGCMGLVDPFTDLSVAQAAIGATDIAMRPYLPPQLLAFTVTKPMLARLASLDDHSFLFRPFLADLRRARGPHGDRHTVEERD